MVSQRAKLFRLSLTALVAAYALAGYLTIWCSPEAAFWNSVIEKREKELTIYRVQNPRTPAILFAGGSSCSFSINPKIIEDECGMATFNLGLPASCGSRYLMHHALERACPGDILVLGLESDFLISDRAKESPTSLGFALCSMQGKPWDASGGATFNKSVQLNDYLALLRPGPRYLITLAKRWITGEGHRYKHKDIGYRGSVVAPVEKLKLSPDTLDPVWRLTDHGRELLRTYAQQASRKGVILVYMLPWRYTTANAVETNRSAKKKLLNQIKSIMPVLEDDLLGATSQIELFSDSQLHLSALGSATRSQLVASKLRDFLAVAAKTQP